MDGIAVTEPSQTVPDHASAPTVEPGHPPTRPCNCVDADQCRGLFCPGRRFYENGFALDSTVDEEERARIEAATPEALVRLLSNENPWLQGLPDALDLLRAADRLGSWVAARQAALVAQVFHQIDGHEVSRTGTEHPQLSYTLSAEEIAPLLRVPGRTAHRMLGEALRLSEDLPGTWEALDAGRISPAQAQVIVEESASIPADAVAGFEAAVLDTAGGLTRPKLARRCRRLREELHPESVTGRTARAVKDRHVTVQPDQDGMAWLGAYLPAEQAHGIFNRVDAAARSLQGPQESRTLCQLRADVFTDVLTHTCTADPKKGTGYRGIGATVFVTVPVMTLLGHTRRDWQDHHAGTAHPGASPAETTAGTDGGTGGTAGSGTVGGTAGSGTAGGTVGNGTAGTSVPGVPDLQGCEPGLLDGYGPIDPQTARDLAAHAPSFTRILVHPETGAVLSVGRDSYRPPRHLQDWVRITNPTCIHPGCNRSAWTSELDHTTPWAHGGTTALNNLKPRCKLHHKLKTDGIWPAGHDDHGTPHITSLGGKTYTTLPEPPPPF